MATAYGNIVNSGSNGGWRAVCEYQTAETATGISVHLYLVGIQAVRASTEFFLNEPNSVQTIKAGASTVTHRNYWMDASENMRLVWLKNSTTTTDGFEATVALSKGHAASVSNVTASAALGSGWSLSYGSGVYEKAISGTSSISISITVPALASYTVSLDAQGGTGAPATLTKWNGEALPLPQPAKDGYTFAGWAKSSAPTTVVYQPGDSYTANSAASLVAVWTPVISAAVITQVYAARDDGRFLWDGQTGTHTSASDDGEYVYIRAWWRVDGADAATISLDATMADTSTVWTGTTQQTSKPGTGELYVEGVAEWGTTQTALVTGQYDVTVTLSTGAGNPSDSRGTTVSTAFFTIDVLAGGHGIAFGKPATQQIFDVGMDANFDQDVSIGSKATVGDSLVIGDESAYHSIDNLDSLGGRFFTMHDSNGAPVYTWYMSTSGNLARREYANGAWQAARYYTPSFAPGDSVSMNGYVSTGYISSSRTETTVVIHIPNGMRGVTSAAVTGSVIVRQNNAYLYGSSASTAVNLSGFTKAVTVNAGGGFIRLSFTGSTQTSAVNNSPISVYFSTLTITFS